MAEAQNLAHLLRASWQYDGEGQATIGRQSVALEGAASLLVGDQRRVRDNLLELPQKVDAAREDPWIRARKRKLRHFAGLQAQLLRSCRRRLYASLSHAGG